MDMPLLIVENLKTHFYTYDGIVQALDGVTFELYKGETFGLIGETGCGKTATALSIMRLLPENGTIAEGRVLFKGENLLEKDEEEMRKIRGKEISMIFQEPSAYLNPVFTVREQIIDVIMAHQNLEREEAEEKAIEALKLVALPDPERILGSYPHELSGGMQQRVMIAMALSTNPDLLIADEPTSYLDVTVQAQILEHLKNVKRKRNLSLLLITHNMGIVAEMCDRVGVMYAGNIVEIGNVRQIIKKPCHPYTMGLLAALPRPETRRKKLYSIKGSIPDLINPPSGCRFHPRCPYAMEICRRRKPQTVEVEPGRYVACHAVERGVVT
ncbi:ABC transporter ATP-binding protein [Candidatus Bathyarchaeota archaeon]|nr:MAG: ABC transporter ATP-binding protein [Candidatus Bathyarchaeota archaeon]